MFPGVIAHTVGESTDQFIVFPIGLLSMAEYVTRNGYRASIDNLGERMIESKEFDPESYLAKIEARKQGYSVIEAINEQTHEPELRVRIGE
jgi:hypothetical protein